LFKATGVPTPDGNEGLRDAQDAAAALAGLKQRNPALRKAVVKLNDGFSGEGNAIFDFTDAPSADGGLQRWITDRLPGMTFVAPEMAWPEYEAKLLEMGGIAEAFVAGDVKRLPSVQYRVEPGGRLDIVSTHDQVTGGEAGHVFEGCRFPADPVYAVAIQEAGQAAADALRDQGVVGRFGIDFISVREADEWQHFALEVNLRKGGTTHPYLMLQHLTDGQYDAETGVYQSRSGQTLCYHASDNLQAAHYCGLIPDDLIDIAVENNLHFNPITQEGVAFHLLGTLSSYGKLGLTCVASTREKADGLYRDAVRTLDNETGMNKGPDSGSLTGSDASTPD
ncbi:MAG: peptide ligase PGM1-related protein, partial [Pseudomonadota bacterium]